MLARQNTQLIECLQRINELRLTNPGSDLLQTHEQEFPDAQHRLATYGTLRPGESNYHVVEEIVGSWEDGFVQGQTKEEFSYPVFEWSENSPSVAVKVLSSEHLPEHWQRIDSFEGNNYRRILVPVTLKSGNIEVCNIYAKHHST